MNKFKILLLVALLSSFQAIGQKAIQLIQSGNQEFESQNYFGAIRFYKDALTQADGDQAFAHYQLGECYRETFDFASAEFHYQKSNDLNDRRYPLSKFQYANMLKINGKYDRALPVFEEFIAKIPEYFVDNERHRDYYNQAKNERDGCILALNALSTPKPDYNLIALGEPVNTDNNDYAPTFFENENQVYISSARKLKKGAVQDSRLGESYTDLYAYSFSGGQWSPLKGKDLVDNKVNTKAGEAAGVFNNDQTIYYYTQIALDGSSCQIFFTQKKDGKWGDIKKLTNNVNAPGAIARHPALSPKGDTLYFSSDRKGGFGGFDLWMSISSNGINWSPAKNLGNEINTPFNEISPFHDPNTNKLFFASDGHRGFGGYDIYLANGPSSDKIEIYNPGYPFNSNKDDIFPVLGKEKGFIASNRNGGPGKFDVYSFTIPENKDVIAEISIQPAIASRNSLFTDDLDFESNNLEGIKNLIFFSLTARLQKIDLVLTTPLQNFYDGLSIEDKLKVERHVNSRYKQVSEKDLEELNIENEYFLITSSKTDKEHIANMSSKYVEEIGLSDQINYDSTDLAYLNMLSESDRRKVDQIIFNKAKRANEYKIGTANYDKLEKKDQSGVDNLTARLIKEKTSLDQLTLSMNENLYLKNLDPEKRKTIVKSIKDKILLMADDENFELTREDKKFYNSLSHEHLESIKHIANAYLLSDAEHLSQFIEKDDLNYYNVLGKNQKSVVDRIVVKIIKNTYLSDMLYSEVTDFNKTDIEQLKSDISGANNLSEMIASVNPNSMASSLNSRDKNRLLRFLSSGGADDYMNRKENIFTMDKEFVQKEYNELKNNNSETTNDKIFSNSLDRKLISANTTNQTSEIDDVQDKSYTQGLEINREPTENITQLNQATLDFYNALSVQDQLKIDRFIAARYINKDYRNSNLINQDVQFEEDLTKQEKTHIRLLSSKLKEETMNNAEKEALTESFVFYNNKDTNAKPKWNRLILSYALDINKQGSYLAKRKDYAYYQSLEDNEKGFVKNIENFRRSNHRILSQSLNEDASDVILPNLVRNIPKYLIKSEKMNIEGELIDNNNGTAVKSFSVALENTSGKKVYETNTNENGEFAFKSINSDQYKLVSANKKSEEKFNNDYFIKDLKVTEEEDKKYNYAINTYMFFDSNAKTIRSESSVLLDEIIAAYKDQPFLLELSSHTDDEGNKDYNEALSLERGNATKNYLIKNGINNSDIVMRFYGSDKPIAPNDNIYGKQFNRRVDIKIKSTKVLSYKPAIVYLAQPNANFSKLATRYNISENELMKLNGLSKKSFTAYKPVRLPDLDISPDLSQVVPLNNSIITFGKYKVKAGETITSIADKLRIPEELIYELNNLKSDDLEPGTSIIIINRPNNN